jgi:hypothetical protein
VIFLIFFRHDRKPTDYDWVFIAGGAPSTVFLLPLPPPLALAFSLRRKREPTLLARSSHRQCAAWQTPFIDEYLCMPLFSLLLYDKSISSLENWGKLAY